MGLAEYQAALARAYVDGGFRKAIADDPASVQRTCGLDDVEMGRLRAVSVKELDFFAGSLVSKRRGEVAKLLPLTAAALGGRFRSVFAAYSGTFLPSGPRKHIDDAVVFAQYVAGCLEEPDWIVDVARYESTWIDMRTRRDGLRIRRFRYLVDRAVQGEPPMEASMVAIWIKSRALGVRYWGFRAGVGTSRRQAAPRSAATRPAE